MPRIETAKQMPTLRDNKLKRLLRIFELSKNEQRVVLIVMLVLVGIAFVRYERRVNRGHVRTPTASEVRISPSPPQTEDEQ
jgi:hypothetical protein